MKNLISRVLTAAVLLPVVIGAIYLGNIALWILLSLISLGAIWEYGKLMAKSGVEIPSTFLMAMTFVFLLGLFAVGNSTTFALWLIVLLLNAFMLYLPVARQVNGERTPNVAAAMHGFFFIASGGFSLWFIRLHGFWHLIFYLLLIWIFDTGGLVGGLLAGRHKLAPDVSPKKSWEGLLMGYLWAVIFAFIVPMVPGLKSVAPNGNPGWFIVMVLVVSTVAQLGDLLESVWKREAGVKDSSSIFPGHGGILDRIDSVFAAAPFYLLYLLLSTRIPLG